MQLRRSIDHRPSIGAPGLNGPGSARLDGGYRQDASLMRGYDEENAVALTDLAEDSGEESSLSEDDGMSRLSTTRELRERERDRRERERLTPKPSPRVR